MFNGKVQGSHLYRVTLDVSAARLAVSCSCPYSFDGLCKHIEQAGTAVRQGVFAAEAVARVLDLMAERVAHCGFLPDVAGWDDHQESYDFAHLEPLLLALLASKESALYLQRVIEEQGWTSIDLANVQFKIAELTANPDLWMETAEHFHSGSPEVSRKLLDKHRELGNKTAFVQCAETAFRAWPQKFDSYLVKHLDKDAQRDLYVDALKSEVSQNRSLDNYRELRTYLDAAQRKVFVDQFARGYNQHFYIALLEVEDRYEDILRYARKCSVWSQPWRLLTPILNRWPDACFELLEKWCCEQFEDVKRNRSTYQYIAECLGTMKLIEAKQRETQSMIEVFYHHKPNLPALKDEFRQAGLVADTQGKGHPPSGGKVRKLWE